MTRKGELWRGDIAQHIEEHLSGTLNLDALTEWAVDHPFFDDRTELSSDERRTIAHGLGAILQADPNEPPATRVSREQLREAADVLWGWRRAN